MMLSKRHILTESICSSIKEDKLEKRVFLCSFKKNIKITGDCTHIYSGLAPRCDGAFSDFISLVLHPVKRQKKTKDLIQHINDLDIELHFFCQPQMFWSLKFFAQVLDILCQLSCSLPPHHGHTSFFLLLLVISLCNSIRLAYYSDSISIPTVKDKVLILLQFNKI